MYKKRETPLHKAEVKHRISKQAADSWVGQTVKKIKEKGKKQVGEMSSKTKWTL